MVTSERQIRFKFLTRVRLCKMKAVTIIILKFQMCRVKVILVKKMNTNVRTFKEIISKFSFSLANNEILLHAIIIRQL